MFERTSCFSWACRLNVCRRFQALILSKVAVDLALSTEAADAFCVTASFHQNPFAGDQTCNQMVNRELQTKGALLGRPESA